MFDIANSHRSIYNAGGHLVTSTLTRINKVGLSINNRVSSSATLLFPIFLGYDNVLSTSLYFKSGCKKLITRVYNPNVNIVMPAGVDEKINLTADITPSVSEIYKIKKENKMDIDKDI
ncbi:hypothetical protein An16g06930 [Aspergillus niger]|uniref:Uncharacterized protein n=2 Tax=Aspergillus niger TaxID=5061 RepID=A2R8F3_ASPNC|nr:hypothetical protein An16g06930 [Aspergillus niger]CAK47015.1 hypothetical protein An16g06930 [Aspergillus niger]